MEGRGWLLLQQLRSQRSTPPALVFTQGDGHCVDSALALQPVVLLSLCAARLGPAGSPLALGHSRCTAWPMLRG